MTWGFIGGSAVSVIGGALLGGGKSGGGQNIYQPTGQGPADTRLQGYFNNYQNPYGAVGGFNTNYLNSSQSNPYASWAQSAADLTAPATVGLSQSYQGYGSGLLGNAQTGQGYVNALQGYVGSNPYQQQYGLGAQQAGSALGGVGQQALSDASGLGGLASSYASPLTGFASGGLSGLQGLAQQTTAGLLPYAQSTASQLPGLASSYAAPGNAAASSILGTAFDPQNALYSRSLQQNQDQVRASLASRGLNSSATGAGIENQATQNFNTDWQNNQLGRQTAGLGAYNSTAGQNYGMQSSAAGQGLNSLLSASSGTFSPYSTVYGQGISGLNTAANTGYGLQSGAAVTGQQLGAAGAQNMLQGAQLPYNAYNDVLNNQIGMYGGLSDLSNSYSGQGLQGLGAMGTGIQTQYEGNLLPYQMSQNILQNQYGGLSNYLGLAGQGQNFDQQQMGNLAQYLGLGTNAGQAQAGVNRDNYYQNQQTAQGIGQGFGSLASSGAFSNMFGPSLNNYQLPSYSSFGAPTTQQNISSFGNVYGFN